MLSLLADMANAEQDSEVLNGHIDVAPTRIVGSSASWLAQDRIVNELESLLRERRARLMVDFVGGDVSVMLTHVSERGKVGKTAVGEARTLADAFEAALLRYDGRWKP